MKLNGVKPRCPVCFDLLDQDKIYTLPCGHAFDHLCILCWLSKSATCPCCRAPADANQLVKVHFDFSTPVERLVGSKASKHASRIQCSWQKWMYERQQKDKRNQRAATTVVVEDTESLKPRAKSRRTGAISRVVNVPLMLVYLAESVLLILAIVASAVAKKSTKLRRNYLSGNLAECLFFNSFLAVFIAIASCATMELENSSARRKYGARNILVYFELLFCALYAALIVNIFHPFLFPSTESIVYNVGGKGLQPTYYHTSERVLEIVVFLSKTFQIILSFYRLHRARAINT